MDGREPDRKGAAGRFFKLAKGLGAGGVGLIAFGTRRGRPATLAGAGLLLGSSIAERWSVFKAGFQSAGEPRYTVGRSATG